MYFGLSLSICTGVADSHYLIGKDFGLTMGGSTNKAPYSSMRSYTLPVNTPEHIPQVLAMSL